jgi:hypothetical protein
MSEMQAELRVELSEGVALLLQRMESHPEEFNSERGKWSHVLSVVEERMFNPQNKRRAEPWMTDEEIRAVWGGYQKIKQKSFHDFVMKKLLDDGEGEIMTPELRAFTTKHPPVLNPNYPMQPGGVYPSWETATSQTSTTSLVTSTFGSVEPEPSPSFIEKVKKALGQ